MRKILGSACLLVWVACGPPPKPATPSLTPQLAAELLHNNNNAQNWLTHVKLRNPSCEYQLNLPAQYNHPTQIDLAHIMSCGGSPAPTEFDASVSFQYDKEGQRWVIRLFTS